VHECVALKFGINKTKSIQGLAHFCLLSATLTTEVEKPFKKKSLFSSLVITCYKNREK
jgi:hypothetical protein